MARYLLPCLMIIVLSACSANFGPDRINISPESMLTASAENVSFNLSQKDALDSMEHWIKDDMPTRAELSCTAHHALCTQAEKLFRQHNIPVTTQANQESDSVLLFYQRYVAKECGQDNLGCAVSTNALKMSSTPEQYLNPGSSDQ